MVKSLVTKRALSPCLLHEPTVANEPSLPPHPTLSPKGAREKNWLASGSWFQGANIVPGNSLPQWGRGKRSAKRQCGALITEALIGMAIFAVAVLPLSVSFMTNQSTVKRLYQKAVAMEAIDGEMEILSAGEWHLFKEGAQPYAIEAAHAKNLPRGATTLTVTGNHLRLEWKPEDGRIAKPIVREAVGK
jgi:hypothetical protein